VAVIAAGYGDGYRRAPGNQVLVHGQRAPVRGRVCMDQIIVGVNHLPDVHVGDEVVLIGRQGQERIGAEEVARRWGTITYEVTSGITARVPRVYKS
jgi:alanine racemase